ncbi:MAG: PIN domain-containing protein [Caldilineae bacterium]|nr:MAG: PIN domain-containing protein [Caldilineae bacterium]
MSALEEAQQRCFVDTNIWLYAFIETGNKRKRTIAKSIIQKSDVVVSTQVVNEVCVNMIKKAALPETAIQSLINAFYYKYTVESLDKTTLLKASELRSRHSLSYWDSLIVANALNADCAILYSEDMQNGLQIAQRLKIANPFQQERV